MTSETAKNRALEERLFANETRPDEKSHLAVTDPSACAACPGRPCTVACPARTYVWSDEGGRIVISHDNCLECGACRAVCPRSVISWRLPRGGMGICYRYG